MNFPATTCPGAETAPLRSAAHAHTQTAKLVSPYDPGMTNVAKMVKSW
jgi:hypothetical protein